jgi:anti-sigma28 factor (negative regulator of flagellin synthesis)
VKIKGSQSERIRELYKKATQGVKTSGTQFSKAVDEAGKKAGEVSKASSKPSAKNVSEARYDDVLAQVDAKTEEFAVKTVASAHDVRKAKVEAIAEAIKNKTYKVDYEAVAERLLASGVLDDDK